MIIIIIIIQFMAHLLTCKLNSRGVYYKAGIKTQLPHKNSTNTTKK